MSTSEGWRQRILRLPLAAKLAGANAVIAALAWVAVYAISGPSRPEWRVLIVLTVALAIGLAITIGLVQLALSPVRVLVRTAERVTDGDLDARVPPSPIADSSLARLGDTLNLLLDTLTEDRNRMRGLAAEVIRVGDKERALVARELHDSVAQGLAALQYQLSALQHATPGAAAAERVRALHDLAAQVMEEVRLLSHSVHPRVLDDLGLVAGLKHLARTVSQSSTEDDTRPRIDVKIEPPDETALRQLEPEAESVLYRVAQEALRNAVRHAKATTIRVTVGVTGGTAYLQVVDDGVGFDLAAAQHRRPGMGLFTMRERTALVGGQFDVKAAPGAGTRVCAGIPTGATSSQTTDTKAGRTSLATPQ